MRDTPLSIRDQWWRQITLPQASDQVSVRKEFMSQVILLMAGAVAVIATILIVIITGWVWGTIDLLVLAIMLVIDAAIGFGHWLLSRRRWEWAIAVLIGILFLLGLYGNLTVGLVTNLNLAYVLAILLAVIFYQQKLQLAMLGLCLGLPIAAQLAHGNLPLEDWVSAAITFAALLIGIALLQWFAADQWKRTVAQARASTQELQKYQSHLADLVAERSAELIRTNEQLRIEIEQHQVTENELEQQTRDLTRSHGFISALHGVTARVESTRDPDQVLATLGSELRALGLTCVVALREADDANLVVRYSSISPPILDRTEGHTGFSLYGYRIRPEVPFIQKVVEQGHPYYVTDTQSAVAGLTAGMPDSVRDRIAGQIDVAPELNAVYLPLMVEDRGTGLMITWGMDLWETDLPALSVFAGQIAGALESARLFQAERQRSRELTTLLGAARAISSTIDLEETLRVIVKQMVKAIDVDGCTISRWDRETDAVITWIEWRTEPETAEEPGLVYPLAKFPATRAVLETGRQHIVQVADPAADPAEVAHMRKVGSKSLLMLPLAAGERVIGLLELDVGEHEHDFAHNEIQLCQALSNQAAVAIENARLYESVRRELGERLRAEEALQRAHDELEYRVQGRTAELAQLNEILQSEIIVRRQSESALSQRNQELNTLYDAARTISSSLDLKAVLRAVAVQTATALNCSGCALSLWNPEQGVLTTLVDYDADRPDNTEPTGTVYNLEEYPATRGVLESGQSLVIREDDPAADPAELRLLAKWQAHSLFMLPLIVHDQVVGLLELTDYASKNVYTSAEIRLAESLAAQAAVAVANARLYEQAQQEIFERRRAEEALRRSEALLQSLVESLPQNIYTKDLQGRFTFVNQRYCQTQGRVREKILGRTDFDLHSPDLASKYQDDDRWVMESQQIFETVEQHEPIGGESTYVRVVKTPLYDTSGQVRGTLGIFWDVTERKRAQDSLARERDLLHALMDNIPDTIYFKDAESHFTRINRAQAEVLGLDDPGQAIGKTDFDFFTPEAAQAAYQDEQEIIRSGRPIIDKLERLQGKGRPPFWASATKVPILDQDRQVVGIVGISRDITERRRTEEELRQSMAELQNLQHITNALLSLEELGQVMGSVAEGIVTHLGYDMVLVSRHVEQDEAFTGMALHPVPGQGRVEKVVRLLGYPELMEDPSSFRVAYHRGENPALDRVLDGETVVGAEMADLFEPWVHPVAAATAQKLLGLKAFINTPMRVKDQTVGTIVAAVRAPTITGNQQQALMRVAGQAAVAIENARLFEAERQWSTELERSNAFVTALSQVAARIEATPDPDRVLETLGAELGQLGITCFLALMEPDGQTLAGRYTSIESRVLTLVQKMAGITLSDFRISRDGWPVQQVITQGQAQYVPDLISATAGLLPQIPKRVLAQIMRRVDVQPDRGAIYLPLKVKEQVLGFMTVWGAALEQEDGPALMAFASQVAVAFENARLYDQAQQEVAARLEVEEQIRSSLAEKEILLKEIHHRVKNNLQIISSLLSLQADHIQDPEALASFRDSQSRIRSMALIHERLYRAPDLARIDFGEYVQNLATYLFRVYSASTQTILLDVQARDVFLDIDTAVSCGLVVNEIISNSLKHAFPAGREGRIRVRLKLAEDGALTIEIADDGIGLPPNLDIRATDSLGLQLVSTLVDQLDGTIEVNGQRGTRFQMTFSVSRN